MAPLFQVDHCCGFSLLFGVEVIAAAQILYSIACLTLVSSKDELEFAGVEITTTVEVLYASWALLGIPLAIAAGVGGLYQMPAHLHTFSLYLLGSMVLHSMLLAAAVFAGDLCRQMVTPELQRLGQHFVCSFVDTFVGFWMLMLLTFQFYCVIVVQSAADHIVDRNRYPELLAAAAKLRQVPPPPPGHAKFQYGTPSMAPPFDPVMQGGFGGAPMMQGGFGGAPMQSSMQPPMAMMPPSMPQPMPAGPVFSSAAPFPQPR